jgi:hypothetical protein
MTHTLFGAALALVLTSQSPSGPGNVTSTQHRFSVTFPAAPVASSVPLASGNKVDRWRLSGDNLTLIVDVSPAGDQDADPGKVLDAVVAHLKTTVKIITDDPHSVDGVTGRAIMGSTDSGFISGRYFVRDGKLYQVYGGTNVTPKDDLTEVKKRMGRVTEFMDTFHFAR